MPIIRNYNRRIDNSTVVNESDKSQDDPVRSSRKINRKLDLLDQKMDGLYKNIYITRPDNRKNLDDILNQLDDAIDAIQQDNVNISGMSELMRRLDNTSGSNVDRLMNSVGELFNDQNLINTLFANDEIHKYIASQNYQYDMICRYLPKLLDALEIKRDNVLSADNFSKEFINPKSSRTNKIELEKFSSNTKKIEREYEISKFLEKSYMNTSKYGEDFVYVVPYHVAFERIIRRTNYRKNNARLGQVSFYESETVAKPNASQVCIKENYMETNDFKKYKKSVEESFGSINLPSQYKGTEVTLHFNDLNIIPETVNERVVLKSRKDMERFQSMMSIYESSHSIVEEKSLMDQFAEIDKKNNRIGNSEPMDGLIIPGELTRDPDKIDKNMLGAVLERLPRENVIPIYIGKVCLGYYYLEFREDKSACGFCGGHHMTPGISNANNFAFEMSQDQQELAIRYIASKISASIDTHFINANKDLKEEIYAVLRYNEQFDLSRSNDIGVTFIPAEDIVHCYFEMDEDTHRGISDLAKSVIPAMLYILLYLTDIIGKITRSTDKRIYYVKQNVETNVARTMMNVVQQIKKGNMGMRQIESMNNILNVIGKYNDFIIPMGQSGDPPISFEVMQGQDIQTPTDIMEKMEEAAVNPIVPFEMLNSTYSQDFAIRFSMSNSRFLKSINTRQRDTETFFSKIYTKVYNYEFGETNSYIQIILPPPIYLTLSNNQQLMDNATQQADKIIEVEFTSEDSDELKAEFKRIYIRNILSTYLDFNSIERYRSAAKVNLEARKAAQVEDGENSGDNNSGDDYGF